MYRKRRLNSLRKDTQIKLSNAPCLTPLDYSLSIPGLLEDMSKEELADEIGSTQNEIDRFLKRFKIPSRKQCDEIRRLLNARN